MNVALVSMPWMAPTMPSIQLAALAAALADHGIAADRHELFLDYAARIGVNLYKIMGGQSGFVPEWIFARWYFHDTEPAAVFAFRDVRPRLGLASRELEDDVIDALCAVSDAFLDDMAAEIAWGSYAVVGFSLTISQLGASMAMARAVRRVAPEATIVFGGTACAGSMGPAILRSCPEVDLVVAGDGEVVFPELVRRLAGGEPLDGLPGVHRRSAGEVVTGPAAPPVRPDAAATLLDFDPFFERLRRLDLTGRFEVWLPFEGSRGCWYGEKAQCTFCGLHEIMKFRSSGDARVLAQLDDLYRRYGIGRFFSVDLILPREFMDTLLPELAGRGADWTIFYETKADLRREQLALMAAAGIRWIQPGIESLDADLLRLMRKGVRPSHNVQLLRWCQELGVQVSWNLLTGIPGSRPEMYDRMAALLPLLHHLPPPTGVGDFQLHRFSPYWQTPEAYGIEVLGAHPLFRHVFPLPDRELDDLVYWLDFRLRDGTDCGEAGRRLAVAAHDWLRAYRDGAELTLTATEDGSVIEDRRGAAALRYELTSAETALYRLLTTALRRAVIPAELARAYPGARPDQNTIDKTIAGWAECGLVYVEQDRVLALATGAAADRPHREAPLGYLE